MKPNPPFQTRATPNPNAYVFEFPDVEELSPWPLAARHEQAPTGLALFDALLAVEDIVEVYLTANFISVVKTEAKEWFELSMELRSLIRKHLDMDILADPLQVQTLRVQPLSADHPQILEWFARRILPATERDGGGIFLRGYANGHLQVEAVGACSGCPHFAQTVEQGIRLPLEQQLGLPIQVESIG